MKLSGIGDIVSDCWRDVPNHFPGIEISEFIVMPKHIHEIIRIPARARHAVPLPPHTRTVETFGSPRAASVPTIVRSFKSAVSHRARKLLGQSSALIWQRNYFGRVIRSDREFHKVRHYIAQNPARCEFEKDKLDEPPVFDLERRSPSSEMGGGRRTACPARVRPAPSMTPRSPMFDCNRGTHPPSPNRKASAAS
jgi:REP element-mobilizing transposase RayT